MAKFYGAIGYGENVERVPGSGVWEDVIVERQCYGDVGKPARRTQDGEYLNSDLTVSATISIVADDYSNAHFFAIRYVRWMGALWTVPNVEVQRPRLILTLGEVYRGPTAD